MQSPEKTLAIIKEVRCGVGDRGVAWLQLSAFTSESGAALQIIDWAAAKDVIEAYGVSDVKQPGLMTWVGPWKR